MAEQETTITLTLTVSTVALITTPTTKWDITPIVMSITTLVSTTITTTTTTTSTISTSTISTTPTISTLITPATTSSIPFQTTSLNPAFTSTAPAYKNTTNHHKQNLNHRQQAGVSIGVLLLFFAVCSAFGWFYYRRKPQQDSQGYPMHPRLGKQTYDPEALELEASAAAGISGNPHTKPLAPLYDQPKDDDAMIRLFKEVDGRLNDHVLNYYVASDGEIYDDEISTLPREARQDLERRVSKLGYLLLKQGSRMFVLRAIIADRIMRTVLEDIQEPDSVSKHGVQAVSSSSGNGVYEFPENAVVRLAQAAHAESKAFAIDKSDSDARLRSMETLVRNAGAFAMTMKRQPTRFELVWLPSSEGEHSNRVAFDPQTMEVAHRELREGHSGPGTVRGAVFPGLQKIRSESGKKEIFLLTKIQALLY